jgi:hypothetical protein
MQITKKKIHTPTSLQVKDSACQQFKVSQTKSHRQSLTDVLVRETKEFKFTGLNKSERLHTFLPTMRTSLRALHAWCLNISTTLWIGDREVCARPTATIWTRLGTWCVHHVFKLCVVGQCAMYICVYNVLSWWYAPKYFMLLSDELCSDQLCSDQLYTS